MDVAIVLVEIFTFILILVPCCLFSFQLILGSFVHTKDHRTGKLESFKILMPAHNEALVINDVLTSLKSEIGSLSNVIVIADNCCDNTADIARKLGATVIERFNDQYKGKGYALDAGLTAISDALPQTIVVLDADCYCSGDSFSQLVLSSQQTDNVVQALYLMKSPDSASVTTRVAEFAWLVKNQIRATALTHLGINCQLQGSGMAFPSRVFDQVSFASGSIVEDLELGLKLTACNESIRLNIASKVISYFPTSTSGSQAQRTRWEHGHLASIRTLPQAAIHALFQKRIRALFSILDAMLPPTVLWTLIVASSCLLTALISITGYPTAFSFCLLSLVLILGGLSICWYTHGRTIITCKDTKDIISFFFNKINLYKSFISQRQQEWIKTDRGEKQ